MAASQFRAAPWSGREISRVRDYGDAAGGRNPRDRALRGAARHVVQRLLDRVQQREGAALLSGLRTGRRVCRSGLVRKRALERRTPAWRCHGNLSGIADTCRDGSRSCRRCGSPGVKCRDSEDARCLARCEVSLGVERVVDGDMERLYLNFCHKGLLQRRNGSQVTRR
jgi:hypothetical protein